MKGILCSIFYLLKKFWDSSRTTKVSYTT